MSDRESPLASPLYPQYHVQRPLPHFSPRNTLSTRTSPRVSSNAGSIRSSPVVTPIQTAATFSPHHFATLSPTTRQTTRALQEIHAQMGFLTPNGERGGGAPLMNSISSVNTPTPSPDEMVIQARGRRQVPLTFSPDVSRSPLRPRIMQGNLSYGIQQTSRLLLPLPTRSSPRKRLTLHDTPPSMHGISQMYSPSPDRLRISPLAKKLKLEGTNSSVSVGGVQPEIAMKAISKKQLESVVEKLLLNHPELRPEVSRLIPTPDLSQLEEKLNFLKKNIYKALPNTRLESKTDSLAYNRVSVHLQTFKKCVVESAKVLFDGDQFISAVDYSIMAWGYVKGTPEWDNPPHNSIRKSCFKHLSTSIMKALKEGKFSRDQLISINHKLLNLKGDSDELMVCLKFLDFCLSENREQ